MGAQNDTLPTISTANYGSGQRLHTLMFPDGSRQFRFDPEPRLVPWDQRHRRGLAPQSTDRSLQAIERGQQGRHGLVRVRYSNKSERWFSPEADEKRRVFFLCIACFSVFPFISVIAIFGGFNKALSWITHGEVDRFSKRQHTILMTEAIFGLLGFVALVIFGILKIHT